MKKIFTIIITGLLICYSAHGKFRFKYDDRITVTTRQLFESRESTKKNTNVSDAKIQRLKSKDITVRKLKGKR